MGELRLTPAAAAERTEQGLDRVCWNVVASADRFGLGLSLAPYVAHAQTFFSSDSFTDPFDELNSGSPPFCCCTPPMS